MGLREQKDFSLQSFTENSLQAEGGLWSQDSGAECSGLVKNLVWPEHGTA